jgi:glyoxylase-like metal-dependent hydrolase (beta-lactamase superfamily II)
VTPVVERVRTSGTFSLDGQDFDVENNVWLVGERGAGAPVAVIDAAHDAGPILEAVGDRRVVAVVCTHGHNDHVNAAADVADAAGAPVALHPDDRMLWDQVHPGRAPDLDLADGQEIEVGEIRLQVLHTPGHTPGGVCLHLPAEAVLFSGDTLFQGGPGATGRSFSDFPTILDSIRRRLLPLPGDTTVHTGHGDSTTIGAEAPRADEWIRRGH